MIPSRRWSFALLALLVVVLISATLAGAQTRTLSGNCNFSGPISPHPPITVVPKPGAHFDYAGKGTCDGTFAGGSVKALPFTLTFTNVATAFDTCELGPDFNLQGTLEVKRGGDRTDFPVTIDLARLALVGPFSLTTPHGGKASGTAQFAPKDAAGAIVQCLTTGVASATLSGSFKTSAPLVGTVVPDPPPRTHKRHRRKRR